VTVSPLKLKSPTTTRRSRHYHCSFTCPEGAQFSPPLRGQLGGPRRLSTCCSHFVSRRLNHYGAAASLHTAFEKYLSNPDLLKQQRLNARKMAEALFDRAETYQQFAQFICE
jgi:hypothetical protein